MIRLDGIRREIAGLVAEQRRLNRPKKPTTAENRQELDRLLAEIESRPPAAPHPDSAGVLEAQQEIDRVLAVLARRATTKGSSNPKPETTDTKGNPS